MFAFKKERRSDDRLTLFTQNLELYKSYVPSFVVFFVSFKSLFAAALKQPSCMLFINNVRVVDV